MEKVNANYWEVFGSHLVSIFDLTNISKALDVGTGWGDCLIPLARRIGSEGEIIGIDINKEAIDKTKSMLKKQSLTNVKVKVMDAVELKFQDCYFDVITCGFIGFDRYYNFAQNKFRQGQNNQVMKEFHRVLKNHGTMVLSTWKLQEDLEITVKMAQNASGSLGYSKEHEKGIIFLMKNAGFTEIQIELIDYYRVYDSLDEWWNKNHLISYYNIARTRDNESVLQSFKREEKYYFRKSVIYAKGKKEI